jgi:hypothetical protein
VHKEVEESCISQNNFVFFALEPCSQRNSLLQNLNSGLTTQGSYLHSVKMALSKYCISGFNWDGKPTGKELKLAGTARISAGQEPSGGAF